jgi:hypothetical protein
MRDPRVPNSLLPVGTERQQATQSGGSPDCVPAWRIGTGARSTDRSFVTGFGV